MKKILLLSMPFGALERPALGLSLLKAELRDAGFRCDVRYLTFTFAEFLPDSDYQWMCYELPHTAFAGDWSFTHLLYGAQPAIENAYVDTILRRTWRLSPTDIARILHVRSMAGHFLDHCMAAIPWRQYGVVGFTSTFEQNIASLALAKRIKAAHPGIVTVFGGANWEGEMGRELHSKFPFVDYVCSGEADRSLPALARRLLGDARNDPRAASIPGVVHRGPDGASVFPGPAEIVRDLDALPVPDFGDYFDALARCTASTTVVPTLLVETSRGCWWGAKSHCTFCGLNGGTMAFRSKTAARALAEIESLAERWNVDELEAVDNILDMRFFRDLLPALARTRRPLRLFYEVKANLSREQVRLLAEAGVRRIQPGIESMSDHVLELMRKGTTALRNVQLLKWAREHSIDVDWNLLYGFPGETAEDYRRTLELLPAIRFLRPPGATGPMRLDRFSPYHATPGAFGLRNVRPLAAYRYLYPFDDESLQRIAYYFDFDYAPEIDPTAYAAEAVAYAEAWHRSPEAGALCSVRRDDGALTLLDTRSDAAVADLTLSGPEQSAYELCDELQTVASVTRHVRATHPGLEVAEGCVRDFLDSLVANRLMVTDGARYLSLALGFPGGISGATNPGILAS